ncbi:MAG: sugar phosphate nucleotidyltransferase [Bacteroidetes bacterium]|nr:sugar phosphate nucleotidyltransferase [Bacteroidota bacterium]
MKAVIMAGGFGTRLRPLTSNFPKPMVPVANKPMMEHIVSLLKKHGITDIMCALFYQPEVITTYFGDGSAFGVSMQYRRAEADYGTAGSVRNVKDFLDSRFIVISGDVLTDFDLSAALKFHKAQGAHATLLLTHHPNPLQFGVVMTNDEGRITRFLEKPSWGEVFSDTINTGIYILEPDVLELIPEKQEFDFSKNLFPLMLEQKMGLYGYVASGYWKDIGSLHEYQEVHFDILRGLVEVTIEGTRRDRTIIGEGTSFEDGSCSLSGANIIGKRCRIAKGAIISNSVIGDNCEIREGAIITNSIVWNDVIVGTRAELSQAVIGTRCAVGDEAIVAENVFVSDSVYIGKNSKLLANIKIWPEKTIEDGSIVTRSMVWEDRWQRELFVTDSRITGLSNVEMNPEFGAKLGAAFGALVGAGATVVTGRDSDNVSRMLNRAIISGLISAGVNCIDMRATSIPIMRHELRSGKEAGGIHVRKSPFDRNYTDIIFFDSLGRDLPVNKSKSLERLFFGEDFARAHFDNVGSISFPERTNESYIERFLAALDVETIRRAKLKLVIDYANGVASTIFPYILGNLDVQVVALNAYLDSRKLTRSKEEFQECMKQLSYVITSLKYDVGCMLDVGAEKIFVVDERGKIISSERMAPLFLKYMALSNPDLKKVGAPITASSEFDIIAQEYNLEVLKTRDSHLSLMEAAADKDRRFLASNRGGFIFNEFLFASDGMYSVAKLLECMARIRKRIGELDDETPRLYMVKKRIPCPWHFKGQVMRKLMKETENIDRLLIDGIKLYFSPKNQYTTVSLLPDRSRPFFYIIAESANQTIAEQISTEYEQKIKKWTERQ